MKTLFRSSLVLTIFTFGFFAHADPWIWNCALENAPASPVPSVLTYNLWGISFQECDLEKGCYDRAKLGPIGIRTGKSDPDDPNSFVVRALDFASAGVGNYNTVVFKFPWAILQDPKSEFQINSFIADFEGNPVRPWRVYNCKPAQAISDPES